jgi:hypothetical protein
MVPSHAQKKEKPAQTQRTSRRTLEIVESDLDESTPKKVSEGIVIIPEVVLNLETEI